MKHRVLSLLIATTFVLFVYLYSPVAMGQQATSGTDVGQQGENVGDHVDSGAAALDSGPELNEGPEANERLESDTAASLAPVTASTAVLPATAGSSHDADIEGNFDLQEIAGMDTPGAN